MSEYSALPLPHLYPLFLTRSELNVVIIHSTPASDVLVNLMAMDTDIGDSMIYTFTLADIMQPFDIVNDTLLTVIPDQLQVATYNVGVVVTDHGSPPLSSTTVVMVTVEPDNDHSPQFQDNLVFNVTEEMLYISHLFDVTDNDTDAGTGGVVLELLESEYSDKFKLTYELLSNKTVGNLTNIETFNHEMMDSLNLTIVATDNGYIDFRRSTTATITVNIVDINDNYPYFITDTFNVEVDENITMGEPFYQVNATDPDTIVDAVLTFTLLNHNNIFAIDSDGWLSTRVETLPARMNISEYMVHVAVNDTGNNSASATVYITVVEVNDHTPQFVPPLPSNITIEENDDIFAYNITATDADLGSSGDVTVTLAQSVGSYFELNGTQLLLTEALDYEVNHFQLNA